jgi:hypothetical protein
MSILSDVGPNRSDPLRSHSVRVGAFGGVATGCSPLHLMQRTPLGTFQDYFSKLHDWILLHLVSWALVLRRTLSAGKHLLCY